MKKLFVLLAVLCLTLVSGIVLSACNEKDTYYIEINKELEEGDLFDVAVKVANQKMVPLTDNLFEVPSGSNVRLDISAKSHGIDMSSIYVSVNNVGKAVIKNPNYSVVPNNGDLNYGYFLLSNVTKDIVVKVSGVSLVKSTFTFETQNLENETSIKSLGATQINLSVDGKEEYVNFYEYLTSEESKSYIRDFDTAEGIYNKYKTFRLKFDGINPFDFENGFPFKIQVNNGQPAPISNMILQEDYFIVDLGNLGDSSQYKIIVDFSNITYTKFNISKPENNIAYSLSLSSEVIDFDSEEVVTITKLLDETQADYSEMIVMINTLQLEKVEGSEIGNVVKYKIPKGITPASTGGMSVFSLSISNINYSVESYTLYANSIENNQGFSPFIIPTFWIVDENGNLLEKTAVGANGQGIALDGQKLAVVWNYNFDKSINAYRSVFDLYDYNISANRVNLLNLKETLAESTEDVVIDFESVYKLRAFYNVETSTFDKFQLEFVCSSDMVVEFSGFSLYEKTIDLSYFFKDSRIESVEYAIKNYENENVSLWQELRYNEPIKLSVIGKQIVTFRLASKSSTIGTHEFKIPNTTICNSWLAGETYVENGVNYTVLKFVVSDVYYNGSMEFKLIPSGSLEF